MKRIFLCLLLALTLATSAAALEVPTDTVVQNLNGSQQLIKTYVLSPDTDPQKLIEEPFEQEGFRWNCDRFWPGATRSHTNTIPQGAKLCGR